MTAEKAWLAPDGSELDLEDRGLTYDIRTLVNRRNALGLFGGMSVLTLLAACGMTETPAAAGSTSPGATSTGNGSTDLTEVPDETGGPYPGDGSNGVNVLDDSGMVRADIRSSFGTSTVTAVGIPLTIVLTVRDVSTGDALTGGAVYVWQCDRDGNYSLYSNGLENVDYLRGVQQIGADGSVTFTSIFPGCYPGRWPHIHFEVYSDLATAIASGPIVKTSQIALPNETCHTVYATPGYEKSVQTLAQVSLASDMVFGDDQGIHQLATMTGSVSSGYTAALTIGV
ncbi:MAG: 3,4-dioxygenase subunit beta [Pseudolysinimonas sp.]